MSKEYIIDGRDPNAKGLVKIGRDANARELIAIGKALDEMGNPLGGSSNALNTHLYVYGCLDDVYGWTIIGIRQTDKAEQYLILDDCMDVLEAPYNKLLSHSEVYVFLAKHGQYTHNDGLALEAGYEWGVFKSTALAPNTAQKPRKEVYVLIIRVDGSNYPEVHSTFDKAVQSAVNDLTEHHQNITREEFDDYLKDCETSLRTNTYYKCDANDTLYEIFGCDLWD